MRELFSILIFPGFMFLAMFSFFAEYVDRILHARLQNRLGPPWFQPVADFIKLAAKEEIIPAKANHVMFRSAPVVALASVVSAFLYVPLAGTGAFFRSTAT